jgi:hypothetical protein
VDVQLLYFRGCPHRALAEERLRSALILLGRNPDSIRTVVVETLADAQSFGFIGSPTVLVDGKDPFASGDEPAALGCRIFTTPNGPAGSPTVEQLVEALSGRLS